MKRREKHRDDRDYDTTQLREHGHGRVLARDYSAHFFRWSFARRFITPRDHVLEIGCGEDRPLSKILTGGAASHVNTYVGCDLNKLKPSESQRLTFLGEFNFVERWKEIRKLRPNGFDVIVHMEVLEHMKVAHGKQLLNACWECLRPNGLMIMSTPCYDGVRHAANHIHEYTISELGALLEKLSFKVERRFGTFMDIKHIGRELPKPPVNGMGQGLRPMIQEVAEVLSAYYDNDALSCIFAPLYPDHARNNLWVCRRPSKIITPKKDNRRLPF
jgi:2-polyprenyl-3-methyl-5-hydroxy-6-metoxy-1,4-benzoquinol methylase